MRAPVAALLVIYAAVSLYPFTLMVSGAFKNSTEVLTNQSPIPHHPTLSTLSTTWKSLNFGRYLLNSLVLVAATIVLVLFVFPLAAYAFAVLRFPLRRTLFGVFVAALFIPSATVLLPVVLLDQKLHLLNTPWAVVLPIVNGSAPLAISLMRAYFGSLPKELREAAIIDGCSDWRVYWRIYFPLSRSALVTITVLTFVGTWNEYILPSVTNNDASRYPLPVGLQSLLSSNVVNWNEVMAGALLLVLPVIVLFALLQRFFVNGLQGAVKG